MAYKKREFVPLSITHPEIAREAHGWDPSLLRPGSNKKLLWKCRLGHTWEAAPNSRTGQGQGCAVCSGHQIEIGFNDLTTTHQGIAAEADGWDPRTVTHGSGKKVSWICPSGHKYEAKVASRARGSGCAVCEGKAVLAGYNDLETTHPDIAAQAHNWDPSSVNAGSDKIRDWICNKGHIWSAPIIYRTRGNNCSICANKKVLAGYNDFATTHPDLAREAFGWDPKTIISGSHKKLSWKCSLGHVWEARPNSRVSMNSGCAVCDGTQVLIGFNDLVTTHPSVAREAKNWDPTTISRGSKAKQLWICDEGHEWLASPKSRTGLESGCPTCSKTGFDPNKDGYLYFLYHPNWIMHQVGITNVPDDRLGRHKNLGWEVLEVRGPMDGFEARQWEQDILRVLRGRKIKLGSKAGVGKFDGYTEAWDANALSVKSIKELMKLVQDRENEN
jgi:hypothetical protein